MLDKFWEILDHFATWLSNKCWEKLYKYRRHNDKKNKK
jgi:hypothetical protein